MLGEKRKIVLFMLVFLTTLVLLSIEMKERTAYGSFLRSCLEKNCARLNDHNDKYWPGCDKESHNFLFEKCKEQWNNQ